MRCERVRYNRVPFRMIQRMDTFGTPHTDTAIRALLLGSGELGKEVAIELQRFAVEVIAVDRYANAPAMQVAHRCARDQHARRRGAARA